MAHVTAGLLHLHVAGSAHGNLHSGNVAIDPLTGECHIFGAPLYALAENPADFAIYRAPEVRRVPGSLASGHSAASAWNSS